jgi:hypothetical protein
MLLRGPYDIEHLNIQTSILIQGWQWETEPSRKLYTTSTEQPSCTGLFEGSKNGSISTCVVSFQHQERHK